MAGNPSTNKKNLSMTLLLLAAVVCLNLVASGIVDLLLMLWDPVNFCFFVVVRSVESAADAWHVRVDTNSKAIFGGMMQIVFVCESGACCFRALTRMNCLADLQFAGVGVANASVVLDRSFYCRDKAGQCQLKLKLVLC